MTTGGASGGVNGLGGTPARAGYSAGDGVHAFEFPQSGNQATLLALPTTAGNSGIAGVDDFQVRNGVVEPSHLTTTGTINFSDADPADVHAIQSVTGGGQELGTLTLVRTADTTGSGTGGQFVWTYTAIWRSSGRRWTRDLAEGRNLRGRHQRRPWRILPRPCP